MLYDKLWILIADAAEARIYVHRPHDQPVLVQHLVNLADPVSPLAPATEGDTDRFAHDLAKLVERARQLRQFDELALVAPPAFLGPLRRHLSERTLDMVGTVVERRHSKDTIETILRALAAADTAHP